MSSTIERFLIGLVLTGSLVVAAIFLMAPRGNAQGISGGGGGGTASSVSISQGANVMTVDSSGNGHITAAGVPSGTTSSSTTGSMVMCNPVSSAPAYTAGQANWLTCDLLGNLHVSLDACQGTKVTVAVSQAGNAQVLAGSSGKKTYICGGMLTIADAESISVVEGTGTTCGTSAFALVGSTTVANGVALAANEGFLLGNGTGANIIAGNATGDNICILQSGTGRLAGWITYAQL